MQHQLRLTRAALRRAAPRRAAHRRVAAEKLNSIVALRTATNDNTPCHRATT